MPRTFTLQNLMIGITLFCILCGLAWNFPQESLAYALLLALFIPTVIVCQILVSFSRERMTTLIIALIGATIGLVFSPPISVFGAHFTGSPRTVWQCIAPMILPMAILPPFGALVLGGAVLMDELRKRR